MIGDKKPRGQTGFTLVEMIVATAIFALAFVAIAAIYLGVTRAQNRSKEQAKVLNETQLIFEQVARELRQKQPDTRAGVCDCSGAPGTFICLTDLADNRSFFQHNSGGQTLEYKSGVTSCTSGSWSQLNDPALLVTKLEFLDSTPSGGHPLTTVIMQTENQQGAVDKHVEVNLQTAVSSRVYSPGN